MPELLASDTYRAESKRQRKEFLRAQLENERTSFLSHWRDLSDFILPRRSRFSITDTNRGDRRNKNIIDSTATLAVRTLRSGMMGGITSPARPWFRLTTPDPDLAEFGSVKEWLHLVSERMSTVFLRSNLYYELPKMYSDIGVFGTSAMYMEEDFDRVLRCYSFPIGSYMIANNDKMKVDVAIRDMRMTVRQLVKKFGKKTLGGQADWSNFSGHVKSLWMNGQYETWIDVTHVIEPNEEYDPGKLMSKYKKYSSCYYERGYSGVSGSTNYATSNDDDKYLSEMGLDRFRVLAPRWEVTGEDVYATSCPGMEALGDIKALQLMQKRKAQAIEKMVNPPMTGPAALKTIPSSLLPGGTTWVDTRDGQAGFRPAHTVEPKVQELLLDIQDHQQRIRRAFYEDLFLMLSYSDRREITAREIDERHEEKLLALGPVLEQLNQDLLDPLIENTFELMNGQGLLPPAPEELQGSELKVEYISVMAQAQKLVGISGIERFAGFVGNIAAQTQDTTVLDKIDIDQMIDEYGDAVGISPRIVRTDEDVAVIRNQRAKKQQVQEMAQKMVDLSKGAKDLSQADMSGDNALTRIVKDAQAGQIA